MGPARGSEQHGRVRAAAGRAALRRTHAQCALSASNQAVYAAPDFEQTRSAAVCSA